MALHAVDEDWLMPMARAVTVAPDAWRAALIEILVAAPAPRAARRCPRSTTP